MFFECFFLSAAPAVVVAVAFFFGATPGFLADALFSPGVDFGAGVLGVAFVGGRLAAGGWYGGIDGSMTFTCLLLKPKANDTKKVSIMRSVEITMPLAFI